MRHPVAVRLHIFQSFQLLGIDKFDRGACYMVAVIDIIEIVGSDVWHVSKQLRETLIYQRLNGIGSSHVWFHVIIIGFACQYMNHIIALTDSSVGGSPYSYTSLSVETSVVG